ncbi:hypothetical protein IB622_02580 [Francisella orientalis]|nr:hypothetical protein [Francisella orientalis]MBK2009163.1 hypothetical protein [Francisella orientalis]MBK2010590.1 hypothetical protein [Francisella orientalis]MBK2073602.1 hypothetical protein [Francisella orientalis]MBK2075758.1 hypothetical protein [Francisella orientalis]MBK2080129.1 hypothetical protein [Francisella orientalis]
MSCVVKHECPTKLDANGNKYMDRNACTQNTYYLDLFLWVRFINTLKVKG